MYIQWANRHGKRGNWHIMGSGGAGPWTLCGYNIEEELPIKNDVQFWQNSTEEPFPICPVCKERNRLAFQ